MVEQQVHREPDGGGRDQVGHGPPPAPPAAAGPLPGRRGSPAAAGRHQRGRQQVGDDRRQRRASQGDQRDRGRHRDARRPQPPAPGGQRQAGQGDGGGPGDGRQRQVGQPGPGQPRQRRHQQRDRDGDPARRRGERRPGGLEQERRHHPEHAKPGVHARPLDPLLAQAPGDHRPGAPARQPGLLPPCQLRPRGLAVGRQPVPQLLVAERVAGLGGLAQHPAAGRVRQQRQEPDRFLPLPRQHQLRRLDQRVRAEHERPGGRREQRVGGHDGGFKRGSPARERAQQPAGRRRREPPQQAAGAFGAVAARRRCPRPPGGARRARPQRGRPPGQPPAGCLPAQQARPEQDEQVEPGAAGRVAAAGPVTGPAAGPAAPEPVPQPPPDDGGRRRAQRRPPHGEHRERGRHGRGLPPAEVPARAGLARQQPQPAAGTGALRLVGVGVGQRLR